MKQGESVSSNFLLLLAPCGKHYVYFNFILVLFPTCAWMYKRWINSYRYCTDDILLIRSCVMILTRGFHCIIQLHSFCKKLLIVV